MTCPTCGSLSPWRCGCNDDDEPEPPPDRSEQTLTEARKLARKVLDGDLPEDVEKLANLVLDLAGPDPRKVATGRLNEIRAKCEPPLPPLPDHVVYNVARARSGFEAQLREHFGTDYRLTVMAHGYPLHDVPPACPRDKFVCSHCGGDNVQHAMWVDPNTDQPADVFGSWNECDARFCNDCEEHYSIVTEEEFRASKEGG